MGVEPESLRIDLEYEKWVYWLVAGGGRPAGSGEVEVEAAELIDEGDEAGWSDDEAMVIVDALEVDDVTEPGAGGWGSKRARTVV